MHPTNHPTMCASETSDFAANYFQGLKPEAGAPAACPRCGTAGLEVRREARKYRGRVTRYVLHCGTLQHLPDLVPPSRSAGRLRVSKRARRRF